MAVTPAIPAAQIVSVTPSVLSAGGTALDLIGLILTQSTRPPLGQVLSFASATDVETYFGAGTQEAALGAIYFLGYDNSNVKPGSLLFAQYNVGAVAAYLRGGDASGLTLAQLQAFNGALTIAIDGVTHTGTVNLAAATSFSNAAVIIADTLNIPSATSVASVTGSIAGATLTVSSVASGTLSVGDILSGTGVTAGRYISALGTGTGGTGTYTLSGTQAMSSSAITAYSPGVTYDSVSGGFVVTSNTTGAASTLAYATGALAASLLLTSTTGAVLSQGAIATASVSGAMNAITAITQNWASFMATWEPTSQTKQDFAAWTNSQDNRYLYAMVDTGATNKASNGPSVPVAAIRAAAYSGVAMIYEDPAIDTVGGELAAFLCGSVASLDFSQTQGRSTMAFRSQEGLTAQVTNGTEAGYLKSYDLNFYGDYTTANDAFIWFQEGKVVGPYVWIDSYVNQIWMNNQFQLALMVLLQSARSIPYNAAGYAMIEAAMMDVVNQALNFGAIQPGVTLSESQKTQINNSAGIKIDDVLSRRGWYVQVKDASPTVRIARGSPPCTFWYTDGGSVQQISLASIEVQ